MYIFIAPLEVVWNVVKWEDQAKLASIEGQR